MNPSRRTDVSVLGWAAFLFLTCPTSGLAQVQPVEIPVSYHGAIPDDGINDLGQIRAAVAAIPSSGNAILVFEPGVYDLDPKPTVLGLWPPTATKQAFFTLSKPDITILGNGATLLCKSFEPNRPSGSSWYHLFHFLQCTNLEVHDLTVKMERLPYSMGRCTDILGLPAPIPSRYFKVDIDPEFQPLPQNMTIDCVTHYRPAFFPQGRIFFYWQQDPPRVDGPDFYVKSIQGPIYEITGRGSQGEPGYEMLDGLRHTGPYEHGRLGFGDYVVFVHQFHHYNAFKIADCEDVLLSNLTVHAWAGQALNGWRAKNLVIDGITVIPDPARVWPMTLTSDAIHLVDSQGTLDISGCHLEGMVDDGVNVYTKFHEVACASGPPGNEVELKNNPNCTCRWNANELYEFYDQDQQPLGTATLNSTVPTSCGGMVRLKFNGSIPASGIAYVCNLALHPSLTSISGCTVGLNRGRGFVVRRDAHISYCNVFYTTDAGIDVEPEVGQYFEGPGGKNVTALIVSMTTLNQGWGFWGLAEGAINVRAVKVLSSGAWTFVTQPTIEDVVIMECPIDDTGGAAVCVRSCDGITIDSCTFQNTSLLATLLADIPPPPQQIWARFAADSLLYFRACKDISILSNVFVGSSTLGDRSKAPITGFYIKQGNIGF